MDVVSKADKTLALQTHHVMKNSSTLILSLLFALTTFAQNKKYFVSNNESFVLGQILYSKDRQITASFGKSTFTIKKQGLIIWNSNDEGSILPKSKVNKLVLKNGNILFYKNDSIVWQSFTKFPTSSKLIVGNDGILKIISSKKTILWENFALKANSLKPPLLYAGSEGPFTKGFVNPTNKLKLYVLFVDWADAKAITKNFDSIWSVVTSNGTLEKSFAQQGKAINLTVEPLLSKKWVTLPKTSAYYFPTDSTDSYWNWQDYTKDCAAALNSAFNLDTFINNSIAVILSNPEIADKWAKDIPCGNHEIHYKGMNTMITFLPNHYTKKYTALMHEIGHSYGTNELYAFPPFNWYDEEMMGFDMMGDSHLATSFIGYHHYRYGWLPFVKDDPKVIYLTNQHSYSVTLTPLSTKKGINVVLIPDKRVTKDSLELPSKLWGIEICQDVQGTEQFFAGKGEKMFSEGDKLLIYTVEYPELPNKRAIRLFPKKEFNKDTDRWRNVFLYNDNEVFDNIEAPMTVEIHKVENNNYQLLITLKPR